MSPFTIAFVEPTPPSQPLPTQRTPAGTGGRASTIGRLAAAQRWAHEPDRTKATAAARQALEAKFERQVDPDGVLSPEELAKRVKSAKTAHYSRLALSRRR